MIVQFDPSRHDFAQAARLIYNTDIDVSKTIFGDDLPAALRAISKLMAQPENPFYYEQIHVLEGQDGSGNKIELKGLYICFQAIHQKSWPELRNLLLALGVGQRLRFLFFGLPAVLIFISRKLRDGDHYISNVSVASQHRGKGHGRELVEHAIQKSSSGGARRIVLDVAVNNETAQSLYRGLGFQIIDKTGFRYGTLKVGVYRMQYRPDIAQPLKP